MARGKVRKDLVQRMRNRILAEDIVEQFIMQLIKSNDKGGAEEFIHTENFTLQLEDKIVVCHREDNKIQLDGEEFMYDFTHLTHLCLSLLEDKF